MSTIHYVIGDATEPQGSGLKVIVHCCNNRGAWGAGFVMALSAKWEAPEEHYKNFCSLMLGSVQMVPVEEDIIVANLVGQDGVGRDREGNPPVRYEAIRAGLHSLTHSVFNREFSVHMPRMGCGLAGGNWNTVEGIVQDTLVHAGIPVTVYDLP